MTITKLELKNFTAFNESSIDFSPGINIFIGANGTGKTHLLKLLYAACDITRSKKEFAEKIAAVFMPYQGRFGRLAHRRTTSINSTITVFRGDDRLTAHFSNHTKAHGSVKIQGKTEWYKKRIECVYIPVKEMLAQAPGFRSLFSGRHIQFEEIYYDIVDRAYLPLLKGPIDAQRKRLLRTIEKAIEGKVVTKEEFFFLKNPQGELEFSLLAEGLRKLALLWLLIQNGTLLSGTALFWDEPEANINPKTVGLIVQILLELQREGIQIFLATHDYVVLKEFDLRKEAQDEILFHSLFRDSETKSVRAHSTSNYLMIHPNTISEAFTDLYNRDIERALKMETKR